MDLVQAVSPLTNPAPANLNNYDSFALAPNSYANLQGPSFGTQSVNPLSLQGTGLDNVSNLNVQTAPVGRSTSFDTSYVSIDTGGNVSNSYSGSNEYVQNRYYVSMGIAPVFAPKVATDASINESLFNGPYLRTQSNYIGQQFVRPAYGVSAQGSPISAYPYDFGQNQDLAARYSSGAINANQYFSGVQSLNVQRDIGLLGGVFESGTNPFVTSDVSTNAFQNLFRLGASSGFGAGSIKFGGFGSSF